MKKYVIGIGEALFDCLPEGRKLGGAPANFAYHVSQFGLNGCAISAIGADELGDEICLHAKKLYLTGATTEKIYEAVINSKYFDGTLPIEKMDDFKQTVLAAAEGARDGDIVLLSPACAAFDKFKNFMERGKYFKQIVMEL